MPSLALLAVVPLCPRHHKIFETDIWPKVRRKMPRWMATLAYVANGDRLLQWTAWLDGSESPRVGVSKDQLALWGVQS